MYTYSNGKRIPFPSFNFKGAGNELKESYELSSNDNLLWILVIIILIIIIAFIIKKMLKFDKKPKVEFGYKFY